MAKVLGFRSSIQVTALPTAGEDLRGMLVDFENEPYWCNGSAWVKFASLTSPSFSGTLTHSGDIVLSGSGKRITGDFSNATIANRLAFRSSTTNGNTAVPALPNGTSTTANFQAYNNADPTNASLGLFGVSATEVQVSATKQGSGSYLPMKFYTSGAVQMQIDTAGLVGVGVTPLTQFHVYATNPGTPTTSGSAVTGVSFRAQSASVNLDFGTYGSGTCFIQPRLAGDNASNFGLNLCPNGGNVLVTGPGGLGYGTGAGGTVTQTTSKATAVTLNKTTGRITMNNAALAGGAVVVFALNNSTIAATDTVVFAHSATGGTANAYTVIPLSVAAGSVGVRVVNATAGSLSEAVDINFSVHKGAIS